MSAQQKIDCRDIYNRLRLQLLTPGESLAGIRVRYRPVNSSATLAASSASAGAVAKEAA